MFILNDASKTSAFYSPIYITAYIGSVSKIKTNVLHPVLKEELWKLESKMRYKKYEEESKKITLDPKNYIEAIDICHMKLL
ncbi:MAG: hypothetical protein AAFS12_08565 [Cyanobacteria bacterium J06632_19]